MMQPEAATLSLDYPQRMHTDTYIDFKSGNGGTSSPSWEPPAGKAALYEGTAKVGGVLVMRTPRAHVA